MTDSRARPRRRRRRLRAEPCTTDVDFSKLKDDFPLLGRTVHGHRVVYLDSASSAQRPQCVLDAMDAYYQTTHANVHRGVYTIAEEADRLYEAARVAVGRLHRRPRSRARGDLHQERHRGRSTWSPPPGPGRTWAPATSCCSPTWSTTPTSSRG